MEYNYLAIAVAAIVSMIVGMLWYSPAVFGKRWMREVGKNPDEMQGMKLPKKEMTIAFIASLVLAFVLSNFVYAFNPAGAMEVVVLALWIWAGFYATALVNNVLWEGKSWTLYLINAGAALVSLVLMALVVGLWR